MVISSSLFFRQISILSALIVLQGETAASAAAAAADFAMANFPLSRDELFGSGLPAGKWQGL